METDVEDFLMDEDNQFSLEEMENALQSNDGIQLSSGSDSQKAVLKESNRSPVKLGKRLNASTPVSYRQFSLSHSSDNSEVNTSSSNSSDNTAKQPVLRKKRVIRPKKPLAKKKKYMNKENISENALEANNRPALLDRTNSSERLKVKLPKDGKDVSSADKVVPDSSVAEKEAKPENPIPIYKQDVTKTEKPIPIYKQAVANVRLTPPPVDKKPDLYEFEVDENEQPVTKKKKRQPRVVKSRRKMPTKSAKSALQNIIVPERTISLRCDNSVKDKGPKSKKGAVRFDIVKSIEKHTDALLSQKVAENNQTCSQKKVQFQSAVCSRGAATMTKSYCTSNNSNVTNKKTNESRQQPTTTVTKPPECVRREVESNPSFDYLIYINSEQREKRPHVAVYKNLMKDDSFEGACRGWDENLQPVLVLDEDDDSISKTIDSHKKTDKREIQPQVTNCQKILDDSLEGDFCGWDDNLQPVSVLDDSKSKPKDLNLLNNPDPVASTSVSGWDGNNVRSTNQIANHSVSKDDKNNSKVDFDKTFGFSDDEDSNDFVEINKDNSKSSNVSINRSSNSSMLETGNIKSVSGWDGNNVRSTNQIANNSVSKDDKNNSKVDFDKNFGFSDDEDSNDFVEINKDNSKSSNVSTDRSSNSSMLETRNIKKPGTQFVDVINRLKGQLNITAVSTPVSTKQTKLNFNFKNKSTVSHDSVADTTMCSPIAQNNSSDKNGLTPTFLKPARRSYTHTPKANKAVRFGTSFVFDEKEMKDNDEDVEDLFEDTVRDKPATPKKVNQTYRKTGKTVKKEEKEIERLVSAMNSQFKKVEEFQLCVEK